MFDRPLTASDITDRFDGRMRRDSYTGVIAERGNDVLLVADDLLTVIANVDLFSHFILFDF